MNGREIEPPQRCSYLQCRCQLMAQLKHTSFDTDCTHFQKLALTLGASRARAIDPKRVVTDERVQLKCRYPPCRHYGRNLMCPPFTPSASQFRRYLTKYRSAILVQVEERIPEKIKRTLSDNQSRYANLIKDASFQTEYNRWHLKAWTNLHRIVSEIEREAFRRNYYLSLGLGAEHCALCQTCVVEGPCKNPLRARPSMEAVGIDVYRTIRNAGLTLQWNRLDAITLNGLVLIG